MKRTLRTWVLASLAISSPIAFAAPGDFDPDATYGAGTLDERVAKLEKKLSGETMLELIQRVEQLQKDVLRLRGELEETNHALDALKKQQKDMYVDLDRRITPPPPPPAPPPDQAPAPNGSAPAPGDASGAGTAPPPVGASPAAPAPKPEGAPPTPPPPPAPAPAPKPDRSASYSKGLDLLKDAKYPEAVREFKMFVASDPRGENADSALFFMGEAYTVLRDFPNARDSYRRLIKDFPQSKKLPDALLKTGFIEYDAGQWAKAKEILSEVAKNYPNTPVATQAQKRLAKMKQEGH